MTLGDEPKNLRKIKIMTRYSVFLSGFCFRKWRSVTFPKWNFWKFFGFCFRKWRSVNSQVLDFVSVICQYGLRDRKKILEFFFELCHLGDEFFQAFRNRLQKKNFRKLIEKMVFTSYFDFRLNRTIYFWTETPHSLPLLLFFSCNTLKIKGYLPRKKMDRIWNK